MNNNQKCPVCGYIHDIHTDVDNEDAKPKPLDYSICFNCFSICQFDIHLDIVKLTDVQLRNLKSTDPETYNKLFQIRQNLILLKQ